MQGKSQQMWRMEAGLSRAAGSQSMWRTSLQQHSPTAHNLPRRRPGLGQTQSLPRKVIQPPGSAIHKEEKTEPQCLFLCSAFWKPDHGAHHYLRQKPIESEENKEKDRKNLGVFKRVRTKSRVGTQFLCNPCHVEPLILALLTTTWERTFLQCKRQQRPLGVWGTGLWLRPWVCTETEAIPQHTNLITL